MAEASLHQKENTLIRLASKMTLAWRSIFEFSLARARLQAKWCTLSEPNLGGFMASRFLPYSFVVAGLALVLSSCGGESSRWPTPHQVTVAWAPNHEKGVNSTGGGYQVTISGQPTFNVPYVSGPTAPTSTITTLLTGTYSVTVRAYAALDAQGGSTGNISAPSQSLIVKVP